MLRQVRSRNEHTISKSERSANKYRTQNSYHADALDWPALERWRVFCVYAFRGKKGRSPAKSFHLADIALHCDANSAAGIRDQKQTVKQSDGTTEPRNGPASLCHDVGDHRNRRAARPAGLFPDERSLLLLSAHNRGARATGSLPASRTRSK